MKFNDYGELASHLVETVARALANRPEIESKEGYSNVSCSSYLIVEFVERDEDGDILDVSGGCKVRFSDHGDRYGSDLSIRFDHLLDSDELGDVDLADWRIAEMVTEAVTFIESELEDQLND